MNFALKTPPGEARIRSVRILIGPSSTRFTRYWFPEESISPSAKPYPTPPLDPYSVRTRSTEASSTCVTTSPIACSYSVFPSMSYQIWCLSIPSCYGERRARYNQFFYPSGFCSLPFPSLTHSRVVPNVWHFLCFAGTTSTNLLMIKLQPKIFDHIMSTVRISFIPSICSQVPVIVIRLPEPKGISVKTSTKNRRFFMVSPLPTAAFFAPPDIWCQIVACLPIYPMMELTISVASIVRVRGASSALPSGPKEGPLGLK
uniref:Sec-independent protein translocase n=2 Tax=Araucaria TaxID=25666 RepID=A0A0N7AK72_ARAHE|nr:Sec-independent protein translocase protein [Araucaria heterophylla]QJH91743.1 Sec-independent protein translocase [Araucaria heterophylla]QXE43717.1 Sec-independent protein translocase protein [Araucaria cunninghamii]